MSSFVVVHPDFDGVWPWAADHFCELWRAEGEVAFARLDHGDARRLGEIARDESRVDADGIRRLACFGVSAGESCLAALPALEEATFQGAYHGTLSADDRQRLEAKGVRLYDQLSEGFWGQSVAEYGLALTLCGLRRIPQLHRRIVESQEPWDYNPPHGRGRPSARGHQFGDDSSFTHGALAGKRVRVAGAGNIGSRYAGFASALGAEVSAWDPYAPESAFHRAGSRREHHLRRLVSDAEIFAPMLPLTDSTRNIVTASHLEALPTGCLVVLVTRALICDVGTLRRRVLADELSLAADVWDVEPLSLQDPLLGRHNVVHTPHNAGRTADANRAWAESLASQFRPSQGVV